MSLFSAETMQTLVDIDESAMPSKCFVEFQTESTTATGGTSGTEWTARNARAVACRVIPGGVSTVERPYGEQVRSIESMSIALSLRGMKREQIAIDSDDEIVATTRLQTGEVKTERYKVIGDPSYGSYATSLLVPVSRVT